MLSLGFGHGGKIEFIQGQDQIDVMIKGELFTSYMYGNNLLKPCLYPVMSPSGEFVTRAYPFREIEGETSDHKHHTGVYFTYGSKGEVNGNSFWNFHDIPPQIKHVRVLEMKSNKNKGSLSTLSHWLDNMNVPILEEKRLMEFQSLENESVIDFSINLTALDTTVSFAHTKEGMFAIRVADWLTVRNTGSLYPGTGEYMNAEGLKTEKKIWGKRSKWVRLEGNKDGKTIGIAIFNHPESINYPTHWHARGYGCFSANPIGFPAPEYGELSLKTGESALFKFRMVIYEGTRTKEQLEELFEDFSER